MSFFSRGKAFASSAASAATLAKSSTSAAASTAKVTAISAATRARKSVSGTATAAKEQGAPLLAEVAQDAKNASSSAAAAARSSTISMAARARTSGSTAPALPGPGPRIVFAAVSRNDQVLAEAVPSGLAPAASAADGTDEASARQLGQKMMGRKAPPGWDELHGGHFRSIRMPIHDPLGVTCYTICFSSTLPGDRAQAFVQKLALMLDPMIDKSTADTQGQGRSKIEAALRPVLERELDNANTGLKQFQIENQIGEVRQIMMQNVEVMLDRQDRLQDLEGKSQNFESAAHTFQSGSRRLRRFHLMNQVKWGVVIGTGVTLAAAAIIVPIVAAVA